MILPSMGTSTHVQMHTSTYMKIKNKYIIKGKQTCSAYLRMQAVALTSTLHVDISLYPELSDDYVISISIMELGK